MYWLVVAAAISLLAISLSVYQKSTNAICKSKRILDGKTCVVTGGTAGMGLEVAKDFARRGARVLIACPFIQEGQNAEKQIIEETGNNNVIFKLLDLASLKSTRTFANEILKSEEKLDVLVNNAGIGVHDDQTKDGLNITMQINYYGHFLLTILLLPLLKKSGTAQEKSRIVNVASLYHLIGTFDDANMNKTGYWFYPRIYANSKFCVLLSSVELGERLKGTNVMVNTADPGAVGTAIFVMNFGNYLGKFITLLASTFFKTPVQGAQNTIFLAVDESINNINGEYFRNCKQIRAKSSAYDLNTAKRLWQHSMKAVQLDSNLLTDNLSEYYKR